MPSRDPLPALPPSPAAGASKDAWRTWARAARRRIAGAERSRRVADAIRAWPEYVRVQNVLLYLAFGSEVDLAALEVDATKVVLVPRNGRGPEHDLSLHELEGAALERHPFGPRQPVAETAAVDPAAVALALVPGLCFDVHGTRIGYGRGYYDRFLRRLAPDVPRVGVSFDALVVEALPRDAHDVLVTHLATESGVRPVRASPA
ncbi:MAG: 5-formyltetrahydrofolate cyclo-ligase [Deinococcales bacterium]